MAKELKVFRMNEFDWVIAESLEQAKNWYAAELMIGDAEMQDVCEVDYNGIGENSGFWREVTMKDFDIPRIGMFKNWQGMFCEWMWFRDVVKTWTGDVPAIIASTEV